MQRELLRYATLAPSSHNTQRWKFKLSGDRIAILPDLRDAARQSIPTITISS